MHLCKLVKNRQYIFKKHFGQNQSIVLKCKYVKSFNYRSFTSVMKYSNKLEEAREDGWGEDEYPEPSAKISGIIDWDDEMYFATVKEQEFTNELYPYSHILSSDVFDGVKENQFIIDDLNFLRKKELYIGLFHVDEIIHNTASEKELQNIFIFDPDNNKNVWIKMDQCGDLVEASSQKIVGDLVDLFSYIPRYGSHYQIGDTKPPIPPDNVREIKQYLGINGDYNSKPYKIRRTLKILKTKSESKGSKRKKGKTTRRKSI